MLKYLRVKNFLSFDKEVTIDFLSNNRGSKKDNIFSIGSTVLSKSKLIYWANASGKTNILKVMNVIVNVATFSVQKGIQWLKPFLLNNTNKNTPSFFEVCFFVDKKEFVYNFEIYNNLIVKEYLFEIIAEKRKTLFERVWKNMAGYGEFKKDVETLKDKTRDDASLLSVLGQFNWQLNKRRITYFFEKVTTISELPINFTTNWLLKNDKNKKIVLNFLKCADIHIDDIQVKEDSNPLLGIEILKDDIAKQIVSNKRYIVSFGHKVKWQKELEYFDISVESGGTQKLFSILRPIIDTIVNEKILFIDEIENRLHFHILQSLLKLFHSNLNKKYQFLFTSHDISLMDLDFFKKEQIGIVNKTSEWSTEYYDLSSFADIRSENDIQKYYNNGALWWIPKLMDFSLFIKDLIWKN